MATHISLNETYHLNWDCGDLHFFKRNVITLAGIMATRISLNKTLEPIGWDYGDLHFFKRNIITLQGLYGDLAFLIVLVHLTFLYC